MAVPEHRTELSSGKKAKLSAIYLVTFFAFSAIIPYQALYYSSINFSASEIGLLLGVGPLLSLIATPFWTGLADARKRHSLILVGGVTAAVLFNATIPLLSSYSFLLVLLVVILLGLLSSHIIPLEDSATMHMLGSQRALYGKLRLWGSAGFGVGAAILGVVFNAVGLVWVFWTFSMIMALNLVLMRNLEFERSPEPAPVLPGVRALFGSPRWLLFFLISFLAGVGLAAHHSFMSLLVADFGPSELTVFGSFIPASAVIGLALLISTASEVPVMFFSDNLLKTFSIRRLLVLSLVVIALRDLMYSMDVGAWQVLAVQALHGFTFATLWLAGVNFVAQNAPSGLKATAQGLFNTIFLGFGFSAGNFGSGALIDLIGIQGMYAIAGGIVLTGLLLVLVLDRRYKIFNAVGA